MGESQLRLSRWLQGTTGVAICALCLAAPASAGTGTDLGGSGGLNYRVTIADDFTGSGLSSYVDCLEGDVAVSGGIDLEGSGSAARMGSSARGTGDLGGTARTWRTSGHNLVVGPRDMSFYGICKESGRKGTTFVKRKRKGVVPGATRTVKAPCPDGYQVIGGGISSQDPVVLATVPYDGKDPNGKPDDGWKARAENNDAVPRAVKAQAICRRSGAWDLAYQSVGVGITGGNSAAATQLCAEGAVTGGGASISGPLGLIRVHESYPFDDADGDATPADGWSASLTNGGMSDVSGVVHAICRV